MTLVDFEVTLTEDGNVVFRKQVKIEDGNELIYPSLDGARCKIHGLLKMLIEKRYREGDDIYVDVD